MFHTQALDPCRDNLNACHLSPTMDGEDKPTDKQTDRLTKQSLQTDRQANRTLTGHINHILYAGWTIYYIMMMMTNKPGE